MTLVNAEAVIYRDDMLPRETPSGDRIRGFFTKLSQKHVARSYL
ncbi:hypothetical protein [Pseudoalteromonas lipolytica]